MSTEPERTFENFFDGAKTPPAENPFVVSDPVSPVYRERNRLVAFLSRLFPSTIAYPDDDPAWPIVYITTPEGQLSWHVSAEEAVDLFSHVARDDDHEWDGHSTDEKYRRLGRLGKGDVRKGVKR